MRQPLVKRTVLVADRSAAIRTIVGEALTRFGFEARATDAAEQLWGWARDSRGDLVIADEDVLDHAGSDLLRRLCKSRPDLPIIVLQSPSSSLRRPGDDAPQIHARLDKPFDLKALVALCQEAVDHAGMPRDIGDMKEGVPLLGKSPAIQALRRAFSCLAETDSPVLIIGEAGAGAELVAEALHKTGRRKAGSFVGVNVSALSDDRMATFLEWQEPEDRQSYRPLEKARGGVLYLEEVGDLSARAQAQLLWLLQSGSADVRLVASTRKNLQRRVEEGLFLEDLFYRLSAAPLRLPPLRERIEDLPEIAEAFLMLSEGEGLPRKRIGADALACMKEHDWPGNIHELGNFLRRAVLLYGGDAITEDSVRAELAQEPRRVSGAQALPSESEKAPTPAQAGALARAVENYVEAYLGAGKGRSQNLYDQLLAEIEQPLFGKVLDATRGNRLKAAAILGLNRNTLRKKLERVGIGPAMKCE
ncbi:MAG: response regulator [Hyphomicrobiales bacterium]|nr:MAG: response regulator [Hyphomicrobiales bacterium]